MSIGDKCPSECEYFRLKSIKCISFNRRRQTYTWRSTSTSLTFSWNNESVLTSFYLERLIDTEEIHTEFSNQTQSNMTLTVLSRQRCLMQKSWCKSDKLETKQTVDIWSMWLFCPNLRGARRYYSSIFTLVCELTILWTTELFIAINYTTCITHKSSSSHSASYSASVTTRTV